MNPSHDNLVTLWRPRADTVALSDVTPDDIIALRSGTRIPLEVIPDVGFRHDQATMASVASVKPQRTANLIVLRTVHGVAVLDGNTPVYVLSKTDLAYRLEDARAEGTAVILGDDLARTMTTNSGGIYSVIVNRVHVSDGTASVRVVETHRGAMQFGDVIGVQIAAIAGLV